MLAKVHTAIDGKTAGELTAELAHLGAELLVTVLGYLSAHPPVGQPNAGVTYAAKIDKAESRIDFHQPAEAAERQIRAFAPAPGAFFEFGGERFRILSAQVLSDNGPAGTVLDDQLTIACGTGALRPTLIQRAGKSAMTAADLLRGFAMPQGSILS
jgi:methionyl-tRNA formyltransferase